MEKGEGKSGEGPAEKQESLGERSRSAGLGLVVGKRGGQTTPVLSPWRLQQQLLSANTNIADSATAGFDHENSVLKVAPLPRVSARKLAATLWELHHYNLPISKMHQSVTGHPPRLRRLHRHDHHPNLYKDKGLELVDPSPSSADLPENVSSLKRHVAASLMQNLRSIERTNHAIQPVSPASYGSSMEVAPYNPAVTPTSSLDFKGRTGEMSYSLKTSTELLKVLNRIWSLEEQHVSYVSLVKAMKKELDHARARIKELVRDQQADQQEIDELMKQIAQDKLARKSKEQDRVNAAVQSVREELEDERKLRKRSESLHRKLARELYGVKTSLANSLKELERERQSGKLLEDLCDEFAWGIRDYEQEVHALRQKSDKEWAERADHEQLILHISESWLDERMQLKQEPQYGSGKKKSVVVDRLRSEIETFLQAKHNVNYKKNDDRVPNNTSIRHNSLESIPSNVVVSASQDEGDEDKSTGSDSHCFELHKSSTGDLKFQAEEPGKSHIEVTKLPNSQERAQVRNPTSLQVKFDEQMARAMPSDEIKNQVGDTKSAKLEGSHVEISISKKSEICEPTGEGSSERKSKLDGTPELNSNYMIDDLIRSQYLLSESGDMQPENNYGASSYGNSAWRTNASPIRHWTARLPSQDIDVSELSSKLPSDLKESTLKAKLLEARTRGQRSRSRLKGSKISF